MPELPEVETVRRGLDRLLPGRRLSAIDRLWPKSFPAGDSELNAVLGRSVLGVRRLGKGLLIDLEDGLSLAVHLKMTGQLVLVDPASQDRFGAGHPSDSLVDSLPDRSTRVVFHFGPVQLYFNDQRKFGWIKLVETARALEGEFFSGLGPDTLDPSLNGPGLAVRAGKRRSPVKAVLLDQKVLAGVGNIYADEALFAVGIHPLTPADRLTTEDWARLLAALRQVMNLSLDLGGSTNRNYVDAEGKRGAYLDFAQVYSRAGQPCRRCGTPLDKIRAAGRGTTLCPHCQPLNR